MRPESHYQSQTTAETHKPEEHESQVVITNVKNTTEALKILADSDLPETTKQKIFRYARDIAIGIAISIPLVPATAYVMHKSAYELNKQEIKTNPDGEYEIGDKQSQKILDYLSGKKDLSVSEKIEIIKQTLGRMVLEGGDELPTNFNTFTREEAIQFIYDMGLIEHEEDKRQDDWIGELLPTPRFTNSYYQAFWKMYKSSGSPKVRWRFENPHKETSADDPRSEFDNLRHTIYIEPFRFERGNSIAATHNATAELAHSKDMADNPTAFGMKSIRDTIITLVESIRSAKTMKKVHDETMYDDEGSVENVHKTIQPQLQTQLDSAGTPAFPKGRG